MEASSLCCASQWAPGQFGIGIWNQMSKKRTKTNRIARRDANTCGVHLGGCMKVIEGKKNRSLDHIIPQSFFNNVGVGADPLEFNEEWNLQVMHKACNTKRAGFIHGLPTFQCPCHYFQAIGRDLYVCVAISQPTRRYLMLKEFVMSIPSGNPNAVSLRVEPVSDRPETWQKGTLRIDKSNTSIHYLISINPSMVESFNAGELARVSRLAELGRRNRRGQGPIPVVYLDPEHNVNFDFDN